MGSVLTSSLKEDKCRRLCRFEHFKRSYENFILTEYKYTTLNDKI